MRTTLAGLLILLVAGGALASPVDEARSALVEGRTEQAVSILRAHLETNADDHAALLLLTRAHLAAGQIAEARESLDRAFRTDPDDLRNPFLAGVLLLREDRHEDAAVAFDQAFAGGAFLERHRDSADPFYLLFHRGTARWRLGNAKAALDDFERALTLAPNATLRSRTRTNIVAALQLLDYYPRAEAILRQLIADEPDRALHRHNLGLVLGKLGRLKEAAVAYREALERDPDLAEAHLKLGYLALEEGRLPAAMKSFDRFCELEPKEAYGRYSLGLARFRQGEFERAESEFLRAIALHEDCRKAYYYLMRIYHAAGRREDAKRMRESFERLDRVERQRAIEGKPSLGDCGRNR